MRSSGCSAATCRIVDGHEDGLNAEDALVVKELSAAFKVVIMPKKPSFHRGTDMRELDSLTPGPCAEVCGGAQGEEEGGDGVG